MKVKSTGKIRRSTSSVRFLLLFAIAWLGFSLFFFIPSLSSGNLFVIFFSLIFVFVGVGVLVLALMTYYSLHRVGKPDLIVSSTDLLIGERFTTTLQHTFNSDVTLNHLVVKLIFRETATYQQGTDTRTVTNDDVFEEFELPGGKYYAGQIVQETYNMQIPHDAMHTLNVRRNKLQWFVHVEADIPKLPNIVEEVELFVRPEYI